MSLDPSTFGTPTPRTLDRRSYPEWRGLVQQQDTTTRGPWAYALGPEAASHLPHAA